MNMNMYIAASGEIGKYSNWKIVRVWNNEADIDTYELYINGEYIDAYSSVLNAMKVLISQFDGESEV